MRPDITQSPAPALSEDAWALLHDLRLRGFGPAHGGPEQGELTGAGLAVACGANLGLTPAAGTPTPPGPA